jgi:hypothetical protein
MDRSISFHHVSHQPLHGEKCMLFTRVNSSQFVANEVFLGLTTILRCQNVGDPDVNYPKLAIQKKGAKIGNCRRRILPTFPVETRFLPSD